MNLVNSDIFRINSPIRNMALFHHIVYTSHDGYMMKMSNFDEVKGSMQINPQRKIMIEILSKYNKNFWFLL